MSEMVERVTEAICQAERDWLDSERTMSLQEATAIAAIKAMREPTIGMIAMGGDEILPERMYRLMIDAALDDDMVDKDRK